jgi:isopentenyl-diphosphate delta-isomerase type 1
MQTELLPDTDQVVLLSAAGEVIGARPRVSVHTRDTPLHLAFSTYVFNVAGEVLLTRRALSKRTWPGVWTNTCCGHPRPGEDITDAIRRRLVDELGLEVGELSSLLPDFAYTATDASGIVENEICPVFSADILDIGGSSVHPDGGIAPNPDEVMDWKWVTWDALVASAQLTPFVFSPWAVQQLSQLSPTNPRRG